MAIFYGYLNLQVCIFTSMTESCGWQFLLSYYLDVEYPFQGYLFTQMYTTCKHKFRILVHNKLYVVLVRKSATSNLCAIVSTVHYPACACAAGVKQCLRVCICMCVCVGQKILKNASSMVAKAFTDVLIISVIRLGRFCTWYKSRWFLCHYFSDFLLSVSWLHPFQNRTWY